MYWIGARSFRPISYQELRRILNLTLAGGVQAFWILELGYFARGLASGKQRNSEDTSGSVHIALIVVIHMRNMNLALPLYPRYMSYV